ncbi:putative Serpin (serine protease inhibitor) [Blattamonas nauphoetae]|uniref:Serpin (Serine protease inhibitor) n=1 Tax=Blattamonas nauphoetae TaxID=2049346 RepID=A0ABQ9XKL6_9EUKA|nr:putative Serpin (serine protease inhibitor) [Blattamonas nauphoetae]
MGNTESSNVLAVERKDKYDGSSSTPAGYKKPKAQKFDKESAAKFEQNYVDVVNTFAGLLMEAVAKSPNAKNYVVSPPGLRNIILNIASGTEGKTQEELLNFLGMQDTIKDTTILDFQASTEEALDKLDHDVAYEPLNFLFVGKETNTYKTFIEHSRELFGSIVDGINFDTDRGKSWVNSFLLAHGGTLLARKYPKVETNKKFYAISSLSFSESWLRPFNPCRTFTCNEFKTFDGKAIPMTLMQRRVKQKLDLTRYAENGYYTAAILPITTNTVGVFVLPKTEGEDAFNETAAQFKDKDSLAKLIKGSRIQNTLVQIPRFSVFTHTDFIPTMKDAGVKQIFEDEAETTLTAQGKIHVNRLHTLTYIHVDERGVLTPPFPSKRFDKIKKEGKKVKEIKNSKYQFKCDRPFYFFIVDERSYETIVSAAIRKPKDHFQKEKQMSSSDEKMIQSLTNAMEKNGGVNASDPAMKKFSKQLGNIVKQEAKDAASDAAGSARDEALGKDGVKAMNEAKKGGRSLKKVGKKMKLGDAISKGMDEAREKAAEEEAKKARKAEESKRYTKLCEIKGYNPEDPWAGGSNESDEAEPAPAPAAATESSVPADAPADSAPAEAPEEKPADAVASEAPAETPAEESAPAEPVNETPAEEAAAEPANE